MLSSLRYAAIARLTALVLGVATVSVTAADSERVAVALGDCKVALRLRRDLDDKDPPYCFESHECQNLVGELLTGGVLLILASLPVKPGGTG